MNDVSAIYVKLYAIISAIEAGITDILFSVPSEILVKSGLETLIEYKEVEEQLVEATFTQKVNAINSLIRRDLVPLKKQYIDILSELVHIRNRVYHRKPLEYGDYPSVLAVSSTLKKDDSFFELASVVKALDGK
jgi:hypothetical protein